MSGLYLPGMEMPKSCSVCWALDDYGDYPRCRITEEQRGYNFPIREKRMDSCPLVPVPEHGRLGDLDELFKRMFVGPDGQRYPDKDVDGWDHTYTFRGIKHEILSAPTIMPADHIGGVNEMVTDKEGEG